MGLLSSLFLSKRQKRLKGTLKNIELQTEQKRRTVHTQNISDLFRVPWKYSFKDEIALLLWSNNREALWVLLHAKKLMDKLNLKSKYDIIDVLKSMEPIHGKCKEAVYYFLESLRHKLWRYIVDENGHVYYVKGWASRQSTALNLTTWDFGDIDQLSLTIATQDAALKNKKIKNMGYKSFNFQKPHVIYLPHTVNFFQASKNPTTSYWANNRSYLVDLVNLARSLFPYEQLQKEWVVLSTDVDRKQYVRYNNPNHRSQVNTIARKLLEYDPQVTSS